jgi:hypothetical protein
MSLKREHRAHRDCTENTESNSSSVLSASPLRALRPCFFLAPLYDQHG